MKPFGAIAVVLLLAGCNGASTVALEPPVGGGWAECPPTSARAIAVPFDVREVYDADDRAAGLYRTSERSFLFVYANEASTLREDNVTRVNAVEVARDANGTLHVCTRVDVATPLEVDDEPGANVVAVEVRALDALPAGPYRVVVNWVAGCRCEPIPRGNATALFDG